MGGGGWVAWRTFEVGGAYGVGVWKAIRMGWEMAGNGRCLCGQ